MGELFSHKSQILLYHQVMGSSALVHSVDQDRLKRNAERFATLPQAQQSRFIAQHDQLQTEANRSFGEKTWQSVHILAIELPALERAWIVFSVVIALLLLLRIEGAVQAVWLLPLIVALYAYDNYQYAPTPAPRASDLLFPSEAYLIEHYLKQPLSSRIAEQHDQLLKGWQLYLIAEWLQETPASDPEQFAFQVERGQFAFDVARLELSTSDQKVTSSLYKKEPPLLLVGYLIWNLFLAWCVTFYRETAIRNRICKNPQIHSPDS